MKKTILMISMALAIWACGDSSKKDTSDASSSKKTEVKKDDGKGVGEIKNVVLNDPLDEDMILRGKGIYDMKCSACHKLSAKRVVGPGWHGVTKKRKPEWIMNMITNVEMMLDTDPEAQKLLEECLTRMPNQNVSVDESRDLVEFMYKNDMDREAK